MRKHSFPTDLFLSQECRPSYPASSGHPPQWSKFFILSHPTNNLPARWPVTITAWPARLLFCVTQVPRAIVNLIELLNIVPLRDLHNDKTLGCPTWFVKSVNFGCFKIKNNTKNKSFWKIIWRCCCLCFSIVCPCILKPKEGSVELQKANELNRAYQVSD